MPEQEQTTIEVPKGGWLDSINQVVKGMKNVSSNLIKSRRFIAGLLIFIFAGGATDRGVNQFRIARWALGPILSDIKMGVPTAPPQQIFHHEVLDSMEVIHKDVTRLALVVERMPGADKAVRKYRIDSARGRLFGTEVGVTHQMPFWVAMNEPFYMRGNND